MEYSNPGNICMESYSDANKKVKPFDLKTLELFGNY